MAQHPKSTTRKTSSTRRAALALALILSLLLGATVPALALPTAQPGLQAAQPTVQPLMLGEYAQALVNAGESVAYGLVLPEDGDYLITPVDDDDAAAFDILVTDIDGNIVADDVFADLELALTAGSFTLTFTAIEDGDLFFVMLGNFGELSQDEAAPGILIPGGIVITTARSSDDYYAQLTVPPLEVAQEVLIYADTGDSGGALFVTAESDGLYNYINADDNQLLRFWTQGGTYQITVSPSARAQAFTLIPFLSGPPTTIDVPGEWEASFDPGVEESLVLISLDTLYTDLTVTLAGDNDDADLDLRFVDALDDGGIYESSTDSGSQEQVSMENLLPGNYYIVVRRYIEDEEASFVVTVEGTPGEPLTMLEDGVAMDGALLDETLDEEAIYYEFMVDEAGSLIQMDLLTDNEDAFFQVTAGRRPGESTWYAYYDYTLDRISTTFVATMPGIYYIGVVRDETPAEFSLMVENLGPAPMLIPGEFTRNSIVDGSSDFYQLEITEPGQILSMILVSLNNRDLDLYITAYDKYGNTAQDQWSTEADGVESVTQAMIAPGVYEVEVRAWADDGYYLFTDVVNPANLVNANLDVTNMTGADVCAIVASNAGGQSSANYLPEETVLGDDESYTVTLLTDTYTLEAYNCDEELIASEIDVFLQGEMFWNLTID